MVMVMVMVIYSALVRSHQSTYEGSFGPVPPLLRRCSRLAATPQLLQGGTAWWVHVHMVCMHSLLQGGTAWWVHMHMMCMHTCMHMHTYMCSSARTSSRRRTCT